MADDNFEKEIAIVRKEYFRSAEVLAEKLRRTYGEGPEGLLRFLERKKTAPQEPAQPGEKPYDAGDN